ncbi:DNA repair protein RadC [Candidatus Woesearchaeota archaeon]|nr:DNA repair protein RadC [Candidatus Woesearchaeota archaeon]
MKPNPELPRERLLLNGPSSLSIRDLIAIILETGSKEKDVFFVADNLVKKNSLKDLADLSTRELIEHEGIGPAKAARLAAALELGKRILSHTAGPNPTITSPDDAVRLILPEFHSLTQEKMVILLLDNRNRLTKKKTLYIGCQDLIPIRQQDILKEAIKEKCEAFILLHNHPSRDATPSKADIKMTKKLNKSCRLLDITLADHIIITDNTHFSFREAGLI